MAASMGRWIRMKSNTVLLNILAKKAVLGNQTRYTVPLQYALASQSKTVSKDKEYQSLFSVLFSGIRKSQGDQLSKSSITSRKHMSNGNEPGNKQVLKLMDFPERVWPHPIKGIKNLMYSILIRGYFDEQFRADSFMEGVQQVRSILYL